MDPLNREGPEKESRINYQQNVLFQLYMYMYNIIYMPSLSTIVQHDEQTKSTLKKSKLIAKQSPN